MIPAGNVPGMILSGLARLPGKKPPTKKMQQDINALFKGVEQLLGHAAYGTLFAGPAAIIWGYQNLLKLAGKEPNDAFPEGVWQFYADYALREDTARHTNETHGFDALLKSHNIKLSAVDRLTSWVMAAITCLHQFEALLENEWIERVSISVMKEVSRSSPEATRFKGLYRKWETIRPYGRGEDAAGLDYPAYRRSKFDEFLNSELRSLPTPIYSMWKEEMASRIQKDLPAYQKQMSILAYLSPGPYGEMRVPFDITQAWIGIISQNNYFLLPVCQPGTDQPLDVLTARGQIATLFKFPAKPLTNLTQLVRVKRSAIPALYENLNSHLVKELKMLSYAPILINTSSRPIGSNLAELRQSERGTGSHALTIIDTGKTFVFDQSHIFFDGAWGAAIAEILTNEALSWAGYLQMLGPSERSSGKQLVSRLGISIQPSDSNLIQKAPQISAEACAETDKVNLKTCLALRKLFKSRNDLIQLTINDLLVLYRSIHAFIYQPSPALLEGLKKISKKHPATVAKIRKQLENSNKTNPSILIPVDASIQNPKDRTYPLNIEIPLAELDLFELHSGSIHALNEYEMKPGNRKTAYAEFDRFQRVYLASLAGFGSFMKKAREITAQGESLSVGAIKMLAHLPPPIQNLLDKLPNRFELLNNLLKGKEVFSNLGAVAPGSTLTRFITAKDDNNQKQLAWGVLTDATGKMHISLRDFRPHVAELQSIDQQEFANFITRDYLDAYATGINTYIHELWRITQASRETQTVRLGRGIIHK